ncbi:MAG TPA: beta-ketoacyl-[acyl-carrier-protein] synthase family protein [Acidimicrobiia bacterium]
MEKRRVAVTGVGVVAAPGVGVEAFWKGLKVDAGPGNRELSDWDPEPWIPKKEHRRLDRFTQFALVAAAEALEQSGQLSTATDRVAVSIGTGIGGIAAFEDLVHAADDPELRASPFVVPMMMCNAASAAISIKYGYGGPATTSVLACAAGAQAISDAFRQIQWGYADAAIAGGSESAVRPTAVAGFAAAKALSPTLTARPFSVDRDGMILGEGAAVLVLEEWNAAVARGVAILAELTGAGSTADAFHVTAPHPDGDGAERAMRLALDDASLRPDDIAYVNAHGTGTDLNDRTEGTVIARVFEGKQPPVSSIKAATGHALGASGAIEAATCVLAMMFKELPPNLGMTNQDPAIPVTNLVTAPTPWIPGPTLSNSFGFGGHNTVLAFVPPD